MDLSHIASHSLRQLLTLTEKKEQFLKAVTDIETEIANALKGAAASVVEVVEAAEAVTPFNPAKAKRTKRRKSRVGKPAAAKKKAKAKKKKSGLTPEGRAKLAANMKARWAARKAGKPAKKGFN